VHHDISACHHFFWVGSAWCSLTAAVHRKYVLWPSTQPENCWHLLSIICALASVQRGPQQV
jgi:hypothetical protein